MVRATARIFVIVMIAHSLAGAQETTRAAADQENLVRNDALKISFVPIGKAESVDSTGYRMLLDGGENGRSAVASVSVSSRLFVDLPGSYGGRLYVDSSTSPAILGNRVYVDTVEIDSTRFTREYWTVYAGMGSWECVVNCYSRLNGLYYILSLTSERSGGKPGEYVDGEQVSAGSLKAKLLTSLRDTTDASVRQFNKLITSFHFNR